MVRRKYLCDVLVNDIGEHGVHGSEVVQCASCTVELSLVMFSKSNLQHRRINGWSISGNGGHMYRIVVDVWVLEDLRRYLCTREVVLPRNIT
jgi:hypothetical protein